MHIRMRLPTITGLANNTSQTSKELRSTSPELAPRMTRVGHKPARSGTLPPWEPFHLLQVFVDLQLQSHQRQWFSCRVSCFCGGCKASQAKQHLDNSIIHSVQQSRKIHYFHPREWMKEVKRKTFEMWFYWVYQWQCLKYAVDTKSNLKNILFKKIFGIYQWECIVVFSDTLENVNEVLKTIQWKIIFQRNISWFSNWILSSVKFCVMWIDEVIVKLL